jgi:hypothetical protein
LIWIWSWDPLKLCDAIRRTTSAPPGQKHRQGKIPKRVFATSSHHSNAPIEPISQSNLSKIIALLTATTASTRSVRIAFCRAGRLLFGPYQQAERLALSGHPVDQTCGIEQRCRLIEELLDVESDFKAFLMKARSRAGIGCAPYSRGLIKPVTDFGYRSAPSDVEKRNTEITIFQATALPTSAGYSKELLITVLNDSVRVVNFCREIASTEAYEILQKAEDRLLWLHRRTQQIQSDPKMDAATLAVAERLSESIRSFRDVAEANKRFVIYKTLVGFGSVFPPMWEDENYDRRRTQKPYSFAANRDPRRANSWDIG